MFRLPSLSEIFGLFTKSRTVASATKALNDAVHCLEDVVAHHSAKAAAKAAKAIDLNQQASAHTAEATQAAAVAANLTSLLH